MTSNVIVTLENELSPQIHAEMQFYCIFIGYYSYLIDPTGRIFISYIHMEPIMKNNDDHNIFLQFRVLQIFLIILII